MSWSSKALPWLIPSVFISAPPNGCIIVITPWIENVDFEITRWEGQRILQGSIKLTDIVSWLYDERGIRFMFYVRSDQISPKMNHRLASVHKVIGSIADFRGIRDLHAKMIVSDNIIMETTANMLTRSLYVNVENVTLQPNPDGDSQKFAKAFFTRHGVLAP